MAGVVKMSPPLYIAETSAEKGITMRRAQISPILVTAFAVSVNIASAEPRCDEFLAAGEDAVYCIRDGEAAGLFLQGEEGFGRMAVFLWGGRAARAFWDRDRDGVPDALVIFDETAQARWFERDGDEYRPRTGTEPALESARSFLGRTVEIRARVDHGELTPAPLPAEFAPEPWFPAQTPFAPFSLLLMPSERGAVRDEAALEKPMPIRVGLINAVYTVRRSIEVPSGPFDGASVTLTTVRATAFTYRAAAAGSAPVTRLQLCVAMGADGGFFDRFCVDEALPPPSGAADRARAAARRFRARRGNLACRSAKHIASVRRSSRRCWQRCWRPRRLSRKTNNVPPIRSLFRRPRMSGLRWNGSKAGAAVPIARWPRTMGCRVTWPIRRGPEGRSCKTNRIGRWRRRSWNRSGRSPA
ncbi:MAG: hypothetical protein M5R36_26560 [Deltaproteobacteria bacterium]|nr:hypothetical protein [Deltaproteobacteria bacterium]